MPLINAPAAWDIATGAADIVIAVVDTGVDLGHPDLSSKIVPGYDFVNGDATAQDDAGHGTHVAGIAAAITNNAMGVAGMAWGARVMPIKVLNASGIGYVSDVAAGIRWAADHGARVINLSLGSTYPSSTMEEAVNYAYDRGLLIVAAAGNEYFWGNAPVYPAASPHVMAVAATNDLDARARYSNTGAYVDIAAPGGDPDYSGDANPRHWITSTLWDGGSTYGPNAGTSMASPHVVGLAALIWSQHMSWTNDQVEQAIESTALDRGSPGRDDEFGWGRIDMHAAVTADTPPAPPPGCLAESPHPYSNNLDRTWTVTNPDPNAATSRVHFSRLETESGYDFANIKDGYGNVIQSTSGSYASGVWSGAVPGRAVQIQLVSDFSETTWGFCVDQIETVAFAPDIDVTVTPITVMLGPGRTTNRALLISNTGQGTLNFSIGAVVTRATEISWLSVSPPSGSVAPGSRVTVTLTFAATDLAIGAYRTNLVITSNDPDETQITVPVTLQVAITRSVYLPWIVK